MNISKLLRRLGAPLLIAGLCVLGGCFALSVHPFYAPGDVVGDPGLVGLWGAPEGDEAETWQFLPGDSEGTYRLVIREGNTLRIDPAVDGVFLASVFELDGVRYMDLFPEEPEGTSEFFNSHIVPAHSLWRLDREDDRLVLGMLEPDAFLEAAEAAGVPLAHATRDGVKVLTGATHELRAAVKAHGGTIFGDSETMQRIQ